MKEFILCFLAPHSRRPRPLDTAATALLALYTQESGEPGYGSARYEGLRRLA